MKNRQDLQGFTLIEVLVVTVFVGILSAIAAPSFLVFAERQRVSASQSLIFNAIKSTQSEAKRAKVNKSLLIGADVVGSQKLQDGVFVSGETLPAVIVFDKSGLPITINGSKFQPISFQVNGSNNQKQCISIITLLGALNTKKGACGQL